MNRFKLKSGLEKLFSTAVRKKILRAVESIPNASRTKLLFLVIAQSILSLLDLAGVALVGLIGSLSVSGVRSEQPSSNLTKILRLFQLDTLSFQGQVAVLGAAAALILTVRTITSALLSKRVLKFLSRRSAQLSGQLIHKLLARPSLFLEGQSTQNLLFAVTSGVHTVIVGIVGAFVTLASEFSLMIVMFVGLVSFDPLMAAITVLLFAGVAFFTYSQMHIKAKRLGNEYSKLTIKSNEAILEVLHAYREVYIRGTIEAYARKISDMRKDLSINVAESAFMPLVSKYAIEIALVVGAMTLSAIKFATSDAEGAITGLTIFLAASSRIAPAILRLQQGLTQIRMALAESDPTLRLMDELATQDLEPPSTVSLNEVETSFTPLVVAKNLSFQYKNSESKALDELNFKINPGTFTAIVGPSGAGKSTLADLILGIIQPTSGSIEIASLAPGIVIKKWPGSVGYVPQNILISASSVLENIIFDPRVEKLIDDNLKEVLDESKVAEFLKSLPLGLDTQLGERGAQLSGGQRQRIGIARALLTRPRLLVLDEATSALDGKTESDISQALHKLHGECTLIVIAHRLSTVKNADQVIYLSRGKILASGTFEKVRSEVPDFDKQAGILGIQ